MPVRFRPRAPARSRRAHLSIERDAQSISAAYRTSDFFTAPGIFGYEVFYICSLVAIIWNAVLGTANPRETTVNAKIERRRFAPLLFGSLIAATASSALAHAPSGALFTTVADGSEVNFNIYPSKDAVYPVSYTHLTLPTNREV